ncbi:unnamed protein product [Adineta ricciae]|uniref:PDZ domain-containing protein n=1 Tax=Adineta ricciae TaxID=249248 RepID=A0A813TU82_ADIRI|nr:unnamed protein product [Adineta ricciae]CAF1056374.1 unnamed protein product [Adineta ricciae]
MLTISSSSLTPTFRRPVLLRRHHSASSDLYRPRTILIEKAPNTTSYGFSIQTYGFASLNPLSTDESACSLLSLSSESTRSRQSSASNSFCLSSSQIAPIQLVTYVDQVQEQSPAWHAGLRPGSVILSVNDESVEHDDHEALVKRITQASSSLKLVVIQQNINKQITLCEQLQTLHKQLQEKEEELKELCTQEMTDTENTSLGEIKSPSPRLQHLSTEAECSSTFCNDKIPLDWRQSVTTFAHQQKFVLRTLPSKLTPTASNLSAKYVKKRQSNPSYKHQRSLSSSSIVFQCSKPSLFRHHTSLKHSRRANHRRAHSHEGLFTQDQTIDLSVHPKDDSMVKSGCSLAMDLSKSFDKHNHALSSSSSSSSTVNSDEDKSPEKIDNSIKQFKWKLKINK